MNKAQDAALYKALMQKSDKSAKHVKQAEAQGRNVMRAAHFRTELQNWMEQQEILQN